MIRHTFFAAVLALAFTACGDNAPDTDTENNDMQNDSATTERPVVEPGTQDVHSYARINEVITEHLELDVTVDFDKRQIRGTAAYRLNNKTGADKLYLDAKNLRINSITADGEPTDYVLSQPDEVLGQALIIDITPETEAVKIDYATSPDSAEALQWLNPQQTAGKKDPFLFTQSQAILARTWLPCQDGPGVRVTYNARVKVPANLMAVMSADNPTERNETGVYEFEMKQPVPSYLMAMAVGDLQFQAIGERTGVYAEPSMVEASAYEFAKLPDMLKAAEDLYGSYRWERYDVIVLPPSFPFGGMENPRLTFATPTIIAGDRSLTSLIAHELAHSWSGNLVTNETWDDFWLNEGFTVYFERRIMEAVEGKGYADMLAVLGYQDLRDDIEDLNAKGLTKDTYLKLSLKGRNPDDGLTDIAYEKGYFFLRTLENAVGRERFDDFLRTYFDTFAFKTMTTERFLEYLNNNLLTTDELKQKVDPQEWIYGENLPEGFEPPAAERFRNVEAQVEKAVSGDVKGVKASGGTDKWSSHEWLFFIRELPDDMPDGLMAKLDKTFGFTESGNSEIQCAWYELAIRNDYEPAYPAVERFLTSVGRRKFLTPLYRAMKEQGDDGLARAKAIYQKARPNYHAVSTKTMDRVLGYQS